MPTSPAAAPAPDAPISFGTLPDRLRARRQALGLSQTEIGQRLGVGKLTIIRYETGVTDLPPERFADVLRALETTAEAFLAGIDPAVAEPYRRALLAATPGAGPLAARAPDLAAEAERLVQRLARAGVGPDRLVAFRLLLDAPSFAGCFPAAVTAPEARRTVIRLWRALASAMLQDGVAAPP